MKKILLTVLLILTTACGSNPFLQSINEHLPETMDKIQQPLQSAAKFFMDYCATTDKVDLCKRNFKLITSAKTDKINENIAGFCKVNLRTQRRHIVVSEEYSPKYQYWIMMHELGHCVLDADHIPASEQVHVMNPYLAHFAEYEQPHIIPNLFNIIVPISYNLVQEDELIYYLQKDGTCGKHSSIRP